MNYENNLFRKGYWIHPSALTKPTTSLNMMLYRHLMKNSRISRDELFKIGVNNVEVKVRTINRLGKFLLTQDRDGWIIER